MSEPRGYDDSAFGWGGRAGSGEPDDDDIPACPAVHESGYPCEKRAGHKGAHMAIGDDPGQTWWWA